MTPTDFDVLGHLTVGLNFRILDQLVQATVYAREDLEKCTHHYVEVLGYYLEWANIHKINQII